MLETLDYLTLNQAQQSAIKAIHTGANVIISGGCKTGKSHLASVVSRLLPGTLLLRGCDADQEFCTMESVFNYFPSNSICTIELHDSMLQKLKKLKRIVIDQASLLRCDYIDHIDVFLKTIRKSNEPFGGIQIIFCCDFCIGVPHINPFSAFDDWFIKRYGSRRFLFESDVFSKSDFKVFTLSQYFLEKSDDFIKALKIIRLSGAIPKERSEIINRAIESVLEEHKPHSNFQDVCQSSTHANRLNDVALSQAPGRVYQFKAKEDGDCSEFSGLRVISTKVGSPIIFNRTMEQLSVEKGMLGSVIGCSRNKVSILTERGHEVDIEPQRWVSRKVSEKGIRTDIVGTFEQMPFKNAFVLHKRQIQGRSTPHILLRRSLDDTYNLLYACLANGSVVSQDSNSFTFKQIHKSSQAGINFTIKHATT